MFNSLKVFPKQGKKAKVNRGQSNKEVSWRILPVPESVLSNNKEQGLTSVTKRPNKVTKSSKGLTKIAHSSIRWESKGIDHCLHLFF